MWETGASTHGASAGHGEGADLVRFSAADLGAD